MSSSIPSSLCDLIDHRQHLASTALINASPLIVWSVLTNYDLLTSRFAHLKGCKMLRRTQLGKVFAQEVRPLSPYPCVSYVVEVFETFPATLSWRGLSSYIKVNQGYFSLQSRDNDRATFVTCAMCIEGALFVPGSVIRSQLELIMPKVLIELRDCAEEMAGLVHFSDSVEDRTA